MGNFYRDNLYKKLKMSDPSPIEFATLKINLNTYNNILQNSIHKIFIIKTSLSNLKMI